jgi:hypothetical protein
MVAQFGELVGITLTRQNRVDNAQAAHSGNVADDVMKALKQRTIGSPGSTD